MHTPAVIPISLKITQQMRCHGPRREMKSSSHSLILLAKPITVVAVGRTIFFILLSQPKNPRSRGSMMARSFVLWLHRMAHQGLLHFLSPQFSNIIWSFAFAPSNPVTCNRTLTLASVLLYPRTLGGGAVHSGWVPFNLSILEQIPPDAKKTPILWAHGIADSTVLFEVGQAGPHFLERAGLSCKFKAYPGLGHPINTEEPHYLESWIRARLQSSS